MRFSSIFTISTLALSTSVLANFGEMDHGADRIRRNQVQAADLKARHRMEVKRYVGPSVVIPTTTTTTTTATTTTTSSAPNPTCTALTSSTSAVCNHLSGGSDGCTPYIVTPYGVTLPYPVTFPSGGHVNVQTIPCSEYQCGQTYLNHGAFSWNPTTTNWNFDPNNNQPDGVYIGTNSIPFGPKLSAHYPNGFCVVWTQVSLYNQHYGEGGQAPVCNCPA